MKRANARFDKLVWSLVFGGLLVTGPGLAAGVIVETLGSGDGLTLSAPWSGATGKASVSFHHDLHNYCIHFAMPVKS